MMFGLLCRCQVWEAGASKESFNLGTSESRQREPTSEQGPRTLGLSLHRENRGSCGPHSSRKVQWFLGVRATGNMCWRINTHSITSVNVSGFGLQCCRRTTCLLLAQLKSSEPSAFSGCSRPVVVLILQPVVSCYLPSQSSRRVMREPREPPNFDPNSKSRYKMSAYLHRSDRMRRVVVQILAGLGLITLYPGLQKPLGTLGSTKMRSKRTLGTSLELGSL